MTLQEIESIKKETLTPAQVAKCIGCDPHYIRLEAREEPEHLGFPVVITGTRVKIPKQAFLRFMRGELKCGQVS